tara:strand:+ start:162 stop:398 length:237 start_codon:yes stop_codon:yes gene_type:complete
MSSASGGDTATHFIYKDTMYTLRLRRDNNSVRVNAFGAAGTPSDHMGDFGSIEDARNAIVSPADGVPSVWDLRNALSV